MTANRQLTIVLPDAGGEHHSLRVLAEWSAAGLLGALVWALDANHGLLVDAEWSRRWLNNEAPVQWQPVAQLLGDERYNLIRLVALGAAATGPEIDKLAPEGAVLAAAQPIEALLPAANEVAVRRIRLLVPGPVPGALRAESLVRRWDANVVVAPENRLAPLTPERTFTSDPWSFPAHTALAVAVVGGLFAGVDRGPFDEREHSQAGDIRLCRFYGRSLRSVNAARRVAVAVIGGDDGPLPELPNAKPPALRALSPQALIDYCVEQLPFVDGGSLTYEPLPLPSVPPPEPIGVLAAIRNLLRYLWERLRRLPADTVSTLVAGVQATVAASVQAAVYGKGSMFQVRFGGRPDALPDLGAVEELADDVTANSGIKPVALAAVPDTWRALRSASLALLDGGRGLEPFDALADADLVGDPSLVVTDPLAEPFGYPGSDEGDRAGGDGAEGDGGGRIADGSAASPAPAKPAITLGPDDVYGARWLYHRLADAPEGSRDAVFREELIAWVERRRPTLWWQVGSLLADSLEHAGSDLLEALSALAAATPDTAKESAAVDRRWRRWLRGTALVLAAVVAAGGARGLGALAAKIRPDLAAAVLASITVVVLVSLLIGWQRREREYFQLAYRAKRALSEREHAERTVLHASYHHRRLSALYQQYQLWARVMSHAVHAPWGPAEHVPAGSAELDGLHRSVAFACVEREAAPAAIARMRNLFAAETMERGWLNAQYEALEALSVAATSRLRVLPELAPHQEQPGRGNVFLRGLVDDLERGGPQQITRRRRDLDVARFVARCGAHELFGGVAELADLAEVASPGGPADDPQLLLASLSGGMAPFDQRYFTAPAQADGANVVVEPWLLLPSSGPGGRGPGSEAVLSGGHFTVTAVRCDKTRPLGPRELTLFNHRVPAPAAAPGLAAAPPVDIPV